MAPKNGQNVLVSILSYWPWVRYQIMTISQAVLNLSVNVHPLKISVNNMSGILDTFPVVNTTLL